MNDDNSWYLENFHLRSTEVFIASFIRFFKFHFLCTIINDTLSDGLNVDAWRASVVSPETGVPEQTGPRERA